MTKNLSEETGLQPLQEDTLKDYKNPLIGYLNINILRGKINGFRIIMKTLSLDYLVLIEITQFDAEGYEIGARRD